tara:strand:+ start:2488 stop:2787 length:300 start_codon:yes stop_codon:yes gene_type:complete
MNVGRVVGTVVASRKDPKLEGLKLLVVEQTDAHANLMAAHWVAIDSVGAGLGDLVLVAQGSSARQTEVTVNRPVDAVVMAIVDEIESQGTVTYQKSMDH